MTAFDIDRQGSLGRRRVFAEAEDLVADGICLDAEGAVWFGAPLHARFVRVLPGGKVTERIELGGRWGVACVLGGPDRRTLFLAVAAVPAGEDLEARMRAASGSIEAVRVAIPGAGRP